MKISFRLPLSGFKNKSENEESQDVALILCARFQSVNPKFPFSVINGQISFTWTQPCNINLI